MTIIFNWFRYNSVKANQNKFLFMILEPSDDRCFILKINAIEIRNTTEVELLGLIIDHKLEFDADIDKLCKIARSKLLIWMFTSKNSMLRVNKSIGELYAWFIMIITEPMENFLLVTMTFPFIRNI